MAGPKATTASKASKKPDAAELKRVQGVVGKLPPTQAACSANAVLSAVMELQAEQAAPHPAPLVIGTLFLLLERMPTAAWKDPQSDHVAALLLLEGMLQQAAQLADKASGKQRSLVLAWLRTAGHKQLGDAGKPAHYAAAEAAAQPIIEVMDDKVLGQWADPKADHPDPAVAAVSAEQLGVEVLFKLHRVYVEASVRGKGVNPMSDAAFKARFQDLKARHDKVRARRPAALRWGWRAGLHGPSCAGVCCAAPPPPPHNVVSTCAAALSAPCTPA
jgi:hypothetical protein